MHACTECMHKISIIVMGECSLHINAIGIFVVFFTNLNSFQLACCVLVVAKTKASHGIPRGLEEARDKSKDIS